LIGRFGDVDLNRERIPCRDRRGAPAATAKPSPAAAGLKNGSVGARSL